MFSGFPPKAPSQPSGSDGASADARVASRLGPLSIRSSCDGPRLAGFSVDLREISNAIRYGRALEKREGLELLLHPMGPRGL